MKKAALLLAATCIASQGAAYALGVTPYLPLNLDPDVESQVERVLILGDEPVMTRPIEGNASENTKLVEIEG